MTGSVYSCMFPSNAFFHSYWLHMAHIIWGSLVRCPRMNGFISYTFLLTGKKGKLFPPSLMLSIGQDHTVKHFKIKKTYCIYSHSQRSTSINLMSFRFMRFWNYIVSIVVCTHCINWQYILTMYKGTLYIAEFHR